MEEKRKSFLIFLSMFFALIVVVIFIFILLGQSDSSLKKNDRRPSLGTQETLTIETETEEKSEESTGLYVTKTETVSFSDETETEETKKREETVTVDESTARRTVIAHTGVDEKNITKYKVRIETERGYRVYDIDFSCDGFKYDYEVDYETGELRRYSKKIDGTYEGPKEPIQIYHIGEQKAKETAYAHAGVTETDVWNLKISTSRVEKTNVYEISFDFGIYNYKYVIHSYSGEIIEYKRKYI